MKKLSDLMQNVNEASKASPQNNTSQKVNFASSALGLRKQGINPSQVIAAQRRLDQAANKNPNLTPTQQYQKLSTNQRNTYFQFGNEIPSSLLGQNINMSAFRQVVQRLRSTKQQIAKAQSDAEKVTQKAQMDASKQQVKESSEFNPPAALTIKRIAIRNYPDGRQVALYSNKQLGLVFSIPYVGKGQTPGEIIPTVQVQATNEDLDRTIPDEGTSVKVIGNVEHAGKKGKLVSSNKDGSFHVVDIGGKKYSFHGSDLTLAEEVDAEDKGEYDYEGDMAISQLKSIISNSMKLKDMLEPDTNLPEWVQAKITLAEDYVVTAANYMEGQQDNQGADDSMDEEVELQEGTLKYHLNQAEKHNESGNTRLRNYHMNVAQNKRYGISSDKIEANKEQLDRFKDLKKQFSEKENEFTSENSTIQKLHDQLNSKNKKTFRELLKKDPGKAVDVARKLVPDEPKEEEPKKLDEAESLFTSLRKNPKAALAKHFGEKSTENLQSIKDTGKSSRVKRIAGMFLKDRTASALGNVFDKRYDKSEREQAAQELKKRGITK